MVIKLYISGISGNKEVKKKQQRVQMILDSKQISYEAIDITEPGKEKDKEFMQQNGKVRENLGKYPLPPQIFNDDDFCGDYEDFDMANEVDELEKFLHIATNSQNIETETKVNGLKEQVIDINNSKEGLNQPEEVTENEVNGEAEAISTSETSNKIVDDDSKILKDLPNIEKKKIPEEETFVDEAPKDKNEDNADNKDEEIEENKNHEQEEEKEKDDFRKTELAQSEIQKSSNIEDSPQMEEKEESSKKTVFTEKDDERENDQNKGNETLNSEKAQEE